MAKTMGISTNKTARMTPQNETRCPDVLQVLRRPICSTSPFNFLSPVNSTSGQQVCGVKCHDHSLQLRLLLAITGP
jgi:hypothetical protein